MNKNTKCWVKTFLLENGLKGEGRILSSLTGAHDLNPVEFTQFL